jgi:MFS family permease
VFVVPVPVLAVCAILIFPALRGIRPEVEAAEIPIRWSVQMAVGAGLILCGLALVNIWSVVLSIIGAVLIAPAAKHILPRGMLRARPGLPAAAAGMFLLSFAFIAADTFVPLMLTQLRGLSLGEAGFVITVSTVTWAAGSLYQSRVATSKPLGRLEFTGASFLAIGIVVMAVVGLTQVPVWIAYIAWMITGLGMGIAFPTLPLSVMTETDEGHEAGQLSSTLLMDTTGMAFGSGIGGIFVAFAGAATAGAAGLRLGLLGAFGIALIAALLLMAVAKRIPAGQGGGAAPG